MPTISELMEGKAPGTVLISGGIEILADEYVPEDTIVIRGFKQSLVMNIESGQCWVTDDMTKLEFPLPVWRE